jgi:hypothetical protein
MLPRLRKLFRFEYEQTQRDREQLPSAQATRRLAAPGEQIRRQQPPKEISRKSICLRQIETVFVLRQMEEEPIAPNLSIEA